MKHDLSRITIDIPKSVHKKFKAFAASKGKTMRELLECSIALLMSIKEDQECSLNHSPNKKTVKAIRDSRKKKNIIRAENAEDLFRKLGI